MPQLATKDLSIGYAPNRSNSVAVLHDINIEVDAGELVCLIGPNGTGKSTLLRTLAGLQAPLGGSVQIQGKDLTAYTPRQRARTVSIALTESSNAPYCTAYSMVALGRHPHTRWTGNLNDDDHKKILWALETVGAIHLAQRQVSELSDGERQRILIARALSQDAKLMLLDEPTSFLDLANRIETLHLLHRLTRSEQISVLLSTHDLDLALKYADRIIIIDTQKNTYQDLPEELALNGSLSAAFSSENIEWNQQSGKFQDRSRPTRCAYIEGAEPAVLWTKHLFERLGYRIAEDTHSAECTVRIETNKIGYTWQLSLSSGAASYQSLNEIAEVLSRNENKEA